MVVENSCSPWGGGFLTVPHRSQMSRVLPGGLAGGLPDDYTLIGVAQGSLIVARFSSCRSPRR